MNPRLNGEQLKMAHRLLKGLRSKIEKVSEGNPDLVYAYKKKIRKELMYDERSKPGYRKKLKAFMWKKQKGRCAICKKTIKLKYSELDRFYAPRGYTEKNVRLVHHNCHVKSQAKKKFA